MSQTSETLNNRFGIPGQLQFRDDPGGLNFAEINSDLCTASLCLQGAHVVTWRPKSQTEPVVWVSSAAKYAPGKSIRGGVPVCWPWFGPHATESSFPGHGFARTVPWQVTGSSKQDSGEIELTLVLMQNEQTRSQWPHATRLEMVLTFGTSLKVDLITHNLDIEDLVIGEALHTYLQIGDIGDIRIDGLDGCDYLDKVDGGTRKTQQGAIACTGEVDRVYLNTETECVIVDPGLQRRIRIAKTGSRSTVVWTPWIEKAEKMGDFGPGRQGQGGWREMVCVESANAIDNVVTVPAGGSHRMLVEYSAEPI